MFPDTLQQLASRSRRGYLNTIIWLSLRTAVESEARRQALLECARLLNLFEIASALIVGGAIPLFPNVACNLVRPRSPESTSAEVLSRSLPPLSDDRSVASAPALSGGVKKSEAPAAWSGTVG
jgi:hypothetical protein